MARSAARHSDPARRSGAAPHSGTAGRTGPARRSGPVRAWRAWQSLPPDRRLAAGAAAGLFLTLFLPWYQETGLASAGRRVQTATASLTGWAAFSWVEAAILLVAIGVLALLFLRAEVRAFHLPGGDGAVVMAAGAWTCLLVVWRIFDKQGVTSRGQFATTSGIEWGIFFALAVAALLAYAGSRIRAAHLPEPPLPGDADEGEPWPEVMVATGSPRAPAPESVATVRRSARPRRAAWAEPVTWDEPAAIAEPPAPPTPAIPLRLVDPGDGTGPLRVPLDDDRRD